MWLKQQLRSDNFAKKIKSDKKTCAVLKNQYICSMNFANQKNIMVISNIIVVINNSKEVAL